MPNSRLPVDISIDLYHDFKPTYQALMGALQAAAHCHQRCESHHHHLEDDVRFPRLPIILDDFGGSKEAPQTQYQSLLRI